MSTQSVSLPPSLRALCSHGPSRNPASCGARSSKSGYIRSPNQVTPAHTKHPGWCVDLGGCGGEARRSGEDEKRRGEDEKRIREYKRSGEDEKRRGVERTHRREQLVQVEQQPSVQRGCFLERLRHHKSEVIRAINVMGTTNPR